MAITWYSNAGQPSDSVGVAGDLCFDTLNRIIWLKGPTNTWVGGAYSNIGPTGPAMLAGTGTPLSGYGQQGNGYIDTVTGNLWLKSASGWSQNGTVAPVVNNTLSPILQGAGPPNASTAPTVAIGQCYIDVTNSLLYPPAVSNSYAGYTGNPINIVGPTGPAMQVQPSLGNFANSYGPVAGIYGGSVTAGGIQIFASGNSSLPYVYVPPQNTSFIGGQVTNYSNTGATLGIALNDSTAGTSLWSTTIASGTVANYGYSAGTYTMIAGHSYVWASSRTGGGVAYLNICPIYQQPSTTGASVGYYQPAGMPASTNITLSGTQQYLGILGQALSLQWYYRYPFASYLYQIQGTAFGSGTVQLNFGGWVSPAITLSAAGTFFSFGPFGVSTAYLVAGTAYSIGVTGSGTLSNIVVNTSVGM